ncbi:INO80 complex subunit E isoform X1 [Electrophorus electricus]|uniref:INO80 complex subunit E N-terminal domain-containing protein n=1 Tax=Electrophorus electricus TaxID=8005 RepID=A0AAY5EA19_ELEEL|nr:INO80 complex subunit E isoform X1 [Electrophorus electricus]XP_035386873.1 INO80 complex subunit E isoform X1 [Electrophorus electricus]
MNGQAELDVDYKRKYKNLKRKLKFLVYEQECFQEELRRTQRKLLKVSRDKSFLLDRLLQYERVDEDSSDSDATASSDSEGDGPREREREPGKKRRSPGVPTLTSSSSPHLSLLSRSGATSLQSSTASQYLSTLAFPPDYLAPSAERAKKERKAKPSKQKKEPAGKVVSAMASNYPAGSAAGTGSSGPFSWVPRQMLSGDAAEEEGESEGESEGGEEERGEGEEAELVIDIPNE